MRVLVLFILTVCVLLPSLEASAGCRRGRCFGPGRRAFFWMPSFARGGFFGGRGGFAIPNCGCGSCRFAGFRGFGGFHRGFIDGFGYGYNGLAFPGGFGDPRFFAGYGGFAGGFGGGIHGGGFVDPRFAGRRFYDPRFFGFGGYGYNGFGGYGNIVGGGGIFDPSLNGFLAGPGYDRALGIGAGYGAPGYGAGYGNPGYGPNGAAGYGGDPRFTKWRNWFVDGGKTGPVSPEDLLRLGGGGLTGDCVASPLAASSEALSVRLPAPKNLNVNVQGNGIWVNGNRAWTSRNGQYLVYRGQPSGYHPIEYQLRRGVKEDGTPYVLVRSVAAVDPAHPNWRSIPETYCLYTGGAGVGGPGFVGGSGSGTFSGSY